MEARHHLSKVPEITLFFWIIKILTTGMGEAFSDFLVNQISPVIAVGLGGLAFAVALVFQFSVKRYVAWVYWLAVVMVSVFGTMAADVLHKGMGIPYIISTLFYAAVLACIFAAWYWREGTLSIHSIYTRHREAFYWATVLTTFALGTAAGDLTAGTLGLGYFWSGVMFAIIFAIPAFAYWKRAWNEVFAFWFAYIITRPLGASFADWMGKSHALGGLGWGDGPVTVAWSILIIGFIGYLAITNKGIERALRKGR